MKKTGPFLIPIADPLADEKMTKKVLKLAKKASKRKQTKRGTKEVVKGIRKGLKGCAAAPALSSIHAWLHRISLTNKDQCTSFCRWTCTCQSHEEYASKLLMLLQDLHPGWRHLTNRCHHPHPCALRRKPDPIHLCPIQGGTPRMSTLSGMIRCSTLLTQAPTRQLVAMTGTLHVLLPVCCYVPRSSCRVSQLQ